MSHLRAGDAGDRAGTNFCVELQERSNGFDRGSFSTSQSSGFMLLGMTLSARNRLAGEMIETISWVRSGW
jgi:hypothetical protein